MVSKLACCTALFAVSILSPRAGAAQWVFYEGNGASQDIVCAVQQIPSDGVSGCENDEARSVRLSNIPAGAMLTVYDDGGCGQSDDFARIRVKQYISSEIIWSFEGSLYLETSSYIFEYFPRDNLDGKISCIQVSYCGDSLCNAAENYNLCPADCPYPGGGGGGGTGGTGGGLHLCPEDDPDCREM